MLWPTDVPIGCGRRYLVLCDGKPVAGYDTQQEASLYIARQKEKAECMPKGPETYACKREWTVRDTGGRS